MADWLNPLLKKWLGTLVRTALTALGAYLVGQGWTDTGHWQDAIAALTPILVGLLWSAYEKVAVLAEKELAKTMQAGASEANLQELASDTSFGQKIRMAANAE